MSVFFHREDLHDQRHGFRVRVKRVQRFFVMRGLILGLNSRGSNAPEKDHYCAGLRSKILLLSFSFAIASWSSQTLE